MCVGGGGGRGGRGACHTLSSHCISQLLNYQLILSGIPGMARKGLFHKDSRQLRDPSIRLVKRFRRLVRKTRKTMRIPFVLR